MSEAPRKRNGHTRAIALDGGCYMLPLEDYERFLGQWMSGQAFYTGRGFHGEDVVIKLSRIEGVFRLTAESIANDRADIAAEKEEAMLRGDDD